jgi:hypothetical protein
MARPIVLWTEIDQTLFIALGMVGTERLYARLRRRLVKPDPWEKTTRRFNPLRRSSAALVRHDLRLKAGSLQLALV